jgi:DNA modification methylase
LNLNTIYCGDALSVLKTFPDNSIDCVVTSPPYYNLRSYLPEDHPDKEKEIGFGGSPEEYVESLVTIFQEVKRVLSLNGICYLNIGDSYASNGIYIGKYKDTHPDHKDLHMDHSERYPQKVKGFRGGKYNIKKKDLMLIPHRVAIALCDNGWYIRSDIIYSKKNSMPSSVKDRPVSSKEYVFLLTKTPNYYWDWESISTEPADSTQADKRPKGVLRQRQNENSKYHENCDPTIAAQFRKQDNVGRSDYTGFNDRYTPVDKVRRRDVWALTVPGSKIKHFAMFNPQLVDLCIRSGCPENGIVLDPFMGAGSVALVSRSLNRNYIGIELNPEYVKTAEDYLDNWRYDVDSKKVVSSKNK